MRTEEMKTNLRILIIVQDLVVVMRIDINKFLSIGRKQNLVFACPDFPSIKSFYLLFSRNIALTSSDCAVI